MLGDAACFSMTGFKHAVIGAGLAAFGATGLHRLLAPMTRGRGAILTFHRVCRAAVEPFEPNALLEITPEFLDRLLTHAARAGYRIVPLDAVLPLLQSPEPAGRFLALTFDDGYRDTLSEALPVLERHGAPFTVFATTGFLDRTARLWWVELERALRALPAVDIAIAGLPYALPTRNPKQKQAAFAELRSALLAVGDADLLAACAALCAHAGLEQREIVDGLCLDWNGLGQLAAHPLATVGCHTTTHPRLALLAPDEMRRELEVSRAEIASHLQRPVRHVCYPYGFRGAAGSREYAAAADLGYASGVTTRPGVLVPASADAPLALPRVSVNGLFQTTQAFDVLVSGAGFALWNQIARVR